MACECEPLFDPATPQWTEGGEILSEPKPHLTLADLKKLVKKLEEEQKPFDPYADTTDGIAYKDVTINQT